jgi:phosphoglucosamine mutase
VPGLQDLSWHDKGGRLKRRTITFGTDGVRGVANKDLLPEDALSLGLAASHAIGGKILVGRDTRLSGEMLARALCAGAASGGASVVDLGVLPTPGVAALAPRLVATAAGVVSASHNPYPDNGIKFFSKEGRKLSPEKEREIEDLLGSDITRPTGSGIGRVLVLGDAPRIYAQWVLQQLRPPAEGMEVLIDCANGAAYEVAPLVFGETGADLTLTGVDPTGTNINEDCGSTHIEELDASGHDVAFAFDGDADRVLALDERGNVVDGDRIIAILARDMKERGVLCGEVVVTVMSNLGFFKAMEAMEIPYEVTDVGDRHVAEAMGKLGASLGGEQSGHVILAGHTTTGDGIVTALALLDVMVRSGKPLSELAAAMEVYPQTLINVRVEEPGAAKAVASSETVRLAVSEAESTLGEEGRVLLRPSGTEPVVRVMVEHTDETVCRRVCEEVSRTVRDAGKEGT